MARSNTYLGRRGVVDRDWRGLWLRRSSIASKNVHGHGVVAAAHLGGVSRTLVVAGDTDTTELVDAFALWVVDAPALFAVLESKVRVGSDVTLFEADLRERTSAPQRPPDDENKVLLSLDP